MPRWRFSTTILFMALGLGEGCGQRAAPPIADGQPPVKIDQGSERDLARADGAPASSDCVVAMRLDTCCPQAVPVHAEELGPCLVRYSPHPVTIPDACKLRRGPCTAVACEEPSPSTLLAAPTRDGSCAFTSECQTDADCVVAEDCRDGCCSCGTVLPKVYALAEPCVLTSPEVYPPPTGCVRRCPDLCWPPSPIPPTAVCRGERSNDPYRRCVNAPTTGYLLWQAPSGYAGIGPAVELDGTGQLRAWKQTHTLSPHQTSKADLTLALSAAQTQQIFAALFQVGFDSLPHPGGGWECYPTLHLEGHPSKAVIDLLYGESWNLLPEMKTVYALLDDILRPNNLLGPSNYCLLED